MITTVECTEAGLPRVAWPHFEAVIDRIVHDFARRAAWSSQERFSEAFSKSRREWTDRIWGMDINDLLNLLDEDQADEINGLLARYS
jgi:hypothetical protein